MAHSLSCSIFFLLFLTFIKGQIRNTLETIEPEPEFLAPLENLTVTQGRDVTFTCIVNHLGQYKVAWIKSDSKAILAIHTHLVAHNTRLSVTHNGHNTWKLSISNVQSNDSGTYMCQINTDPMRSQMGHLEIVVPPDILDDGSSDDYVALEGGTIKLRCLTTGTPDPSVHWKREDNKHIIFRQENNREKQVKFHENENLLLQNVHRTDMGMYLCIASNGVPPIVSKRFFVQVHFHPVIKVTNQLIVAPVGKDVFLQCYVETSPKAMYSWFKDTGEKLMPSIKYTILETQLNDYSLVMNLTIRNMERKDFGSYQCIAVNALGKAEGIIRLQELRQDKPTTTQSSFLNRFKEIEKPQRKEPEFNHGKDKHYHKKKKQQKTEEEKQEVTTGLSKTDVKLVDTITWSINQSSHHKTNFDENNRSNEIGLPVMNICTFLVVLSVCF
ncbi:lachesin isoform X2 [Bemisia tabaci]|uniref:lachesin isoform X2 n=1 Tax=Bemisia tabaci TaxID=7038 RepID=UPI0008F9A013|nr:PREDICTED: lachesin-like [Bemisia tabaci]